MAKFCAICGTRNEDDNAMRCCHCGSFFSNMMNTPNVGRNSNNNGHPNQNNGGVYRNYSGDYSGNPNNNNSGNAVNYLRIQQPNRGRSAKNTLKIIAAVIAVVLVAFGVYAYKYTGYRGAMTYFKIYFDNYDYDRIVDNYSTVVFNTSNPDNNYEELDAEAKAKLDSIFDYFDSEIGGSSYKLKFEVVENYIMPDDEYDDFMNSIDYPQKDDIIHNARVVEFEITANHNGKKSSRNVELILTLEDDNNWKIYSFDEK